METFDDRVPEDGASEKKEDSEAVKQFKTELQRFGMLLPMIGLWLLFHGVFGWPTSWAGHLGATVIAYGVAMLSPLSMGSLLRRLDRDGVSDAYESVAITVMFFAAIIFLSTLAAIFMSVAGFGDSIGTVTSACQIIYIGSFAILFDI